MIKVTVSLVYKFEYPDHSVFEARELAVEDFNEAIRCEGWFGEDSLYMKVVGTEEEVE